MDHGAVNKPSPEAGKRFLNAKMCQDQRFGWTAPVT